MLLQFDRSALESIMKSFYQITKIRIALIGPDFKEIFAYPPVFTDFCNYMRNGGTSCLCCEKSDHTAFEICQKRSEPIIYTCHAGLTEAACALRQDGDIIGYIMFGQVISRLKKRYLQTDISNLCIQYDCDEIKLRKAAQHLHCKCDSDLLAAMKIFDICIQYILQRQLIKRRNDELITQMNIWIDEHLSEPLRTDMVAYSLHVSRTQLYELVRRQLGMGVAAYIKEKRLERAASMLINTKLSPVKIADLCGIPDAGYFRRIFRKKYGISPTSYRKKM